MATPTPPPERPGRDAFSLVAARIEARAVAASGSTAPACPHCHGRGWLLKPDGGAGKAVHCTCRRADRRHSLQVFADIPERYLGCTLDGFETTVSADRMVNGSLLAARRTCSEFIDSFLLDRQNGLGLIFYGPPGAGKTHLAVAVLRELMSRYQVRGRYADFSALMFAIHSTFDDESNESLASVLKPTMDAEVLVLDELGAQKPTDWVLQNLYWIINRRYNARRPTIFTTNYHLDPADVAASEVSAEKLAARLSPQLVSRLYEMAKPVKMPNIDFRREHRAAQRPRLKL